MLRPTRHTMKKLIVPESEVLRQCIAYLYARRIFAWRNNTGAAKTEDGRFVRFGLPGASDILGILPGGKFLAVECKRSSGGKVSPQQQAFLDRIKKEGGVAIIATSVEDLIRRLENEQ